MKTFKDRLIKTVERWNGYDQPLTLTANGVLLADKASRNGEFKSVDGLDLEQFSDSDNIVVANPNVAGSYCINTPESNIWQ